LIPPLPLLPAPFFDSITVIPDSPPPASAGSRLFRCFVKIFQADFLVVFNKIGLKIINIYVYCEFLPFFDLFRDFMINLIN
jgi:hypothetical protein